MSVFSNLEQQQEQMCWGCNADIKMNLLFAHFGNQLGTVS